MKTNPNNFFNLTLIVVLALLVAAFNLSNASAQTGTPQTPSEPTPQETATVAPPPAPVCDSSRSIQVSGTAVINVTPTGF